MNQEIRIRTPQRPRDVQLATKLAKKLIPDPLLKYLRSRGELPKKQIIIISFYTKGGYYEQKANELRDACDRLGMKHDIQPIVFPKGASWSEICRAKVKFYRKMLLKHRRSVMWVDVDTKLLRNLDELASSSYDIGVFMRGFRFLPQENFSIYTRRFHPGYIIFNYTRETLEVLYECKRVEEETKGAFTDDYILEEAFRRTKARPRILVLSPNDITRPQDKESRAAFFLHGDSGNVKEHKQQVLQHTPDIQRPESVKAVLEGLIKNAIAEKNISLACDYYREILKLFPDDIFSYHKLLELSAKLSSTDVERMLSRYDSSDLLRAYGLRFKLLQAIESRDWSLADDVYSEILDSGNKAVIDFSKSRMFRVSLDRRAEDMGVDDSKRTGLFWWEQPYPGNLGDIVNPYIVEKITGIPPRWQGRGVGICAIGSVIKYAKAGTAVWGSGTPSANVTLAPKAKYLAVRGPITRDIVIKSGGQCPPIYGDPAWLLPIIYPKARSSTRRTGLILHFTHEELRVKVSDDIKRISIRRLGYKEIEEFLDEVLDCDRIISTSLHGVIIAQAYGIPACLATVTDSSTQIHGDGTKFDDYYRSIGYNAAPEPVDLAGLSIVDDKNIPLDLFKSARANIDVLALINAAPFEVADSVKRKVASFTFS